MSVLVSIKAFDLAVTVSNIMHANGPEDPDVAYWHALAELHSGRPDSAMEIAVSAIKSLGQNPRLLMVVGLAMAAVGSLQNAGSAVQNALQNGAQAIAMAHLAEVLRLMGRHKDAVAVAQKCLNDGCNDAEAYLLAGYAYYDDGQVDQAIAHYEKAVELKPYYLDAHDALNKALWEHGHHSRFLQSFEKAATSLPDLLALRLRHAHFQILAGDLAGAADLLEVCLDRYGPNARVFAELASVREQLDKEFDVKPLYEQAYALDTADTGMLKAYGRALIADADYEKAAKILSESLSLDPFDQETIGFLAVCNGHIDEPEAARVNDYEGLVQIFDLPLPAGYGSIRDFNEALLRALQPLHRTDVAPIDQTLAHGTQTHGNLFKSGNRDICELEAQLRLCIGKYIEHLKTTDARELNDRIAGNFDFSGAWSVQLKEGGFHHDHVHSAGWISSVYYVEVPEELDAENHEGWLKFGDVRIDPNNRGPHRFVEPKPGRLVLFPSYMLHGTVPILGRKRRTTVAFDVVPA